MKRVLTVIFMCIVCLFLSSCGNFVPSFNKKPTTSNSIDTEQNALSLDNIDPSFQKLYHKNNDFRGWITYPTTNTSLSNIDSPIMQSEDNQYYLFCDFNGTPAENGTAFFDYRNQLSSPNATNRNTVIYGHDVDMFANLNNLLLSIDNARSAPTFTMNTLYEKADYKVFAVMLVNTDGTEGIPFSYHHTDFDNDADFASFLSEICARSLYTYGDVDVLPDDEIVTLSVHSRDVLTHFSNGCAVIVARKVREGENPTTDVSQISCNADVIMPYAWYVNQNLQPHRYYTDPSYVIPSLY